MKHGSKLLKVAILKLIIKNIDLCDYRMTMVALAEMNVGDKVLFEYERLHDNYYLEVANETI